MGTPPFQMKPLEQYLNDHLSGSAGALSLLKALAASDPQDSAFYLVLREGIAANRQALLNIMWELGCRRVHSREVLGKAVSKAGQFRLHWHGLSPGKLGLLEALEVLELGIHGQLMLWSVLREEAASRGADTGQDFEELTASAEIQRAQVEKRRMAAAGKAFAAGRRA
ncbi:MAG: hypothetical protein JWM59_3401 [Verrucomicrobiales bacterium]|nr:hypothetical protein [Verrucomicrobiales bacterium]